MWLVGDSTPGVLDLRVHPIVHHRASSIVRD